jgi:hypothetical protein
MRRNLYLAMINKTNNIIQRITHVSIIDEADQCVNAQRGTITVAQGGA